MMSPGQLGLAQAWLLCMIFGHKDPETINVQVRGRLMFATVCPRCGEQV